MSLRDVTDLLPPYLHERCAFRGIGSSAPQLQGELVLYWMRMALRGHENPALDAALHVASALGRPLLVYQGLSERYPFASDRHHTFILQAAREVHHELSLRGVHYRLHVERDGHRGPVLKQLAARACAVFTELAPVEPLRAWTRTLAAHAPCPVVEVDTACVVPMTLSRRPPERAFRFRAALAAERSARVHAPWPEPPATPALPLPADLGFEPVDLDSVDLHDLVAACEIDHAVAPVPATPGGARAGYARWEDFKQRGLDTYAQRRNNPLDRDGVSRLSPWLHLGCVSPLRIAREAAARGSAGAEKLLDELLVWRELAWHWCACTPEPDSLQALPAWAQATLQAHAHDPRPQRLSEEALARAQSGDPLWDAAQLSLLRHGELHNNVRMTWGKALLGWTASPQEALRRLIDLNHRYALDGRDPASYGGLLGCLGLFERPAEEHQPIYGAVRTRTPQAHAARLDTAAFGALVRRPIGATPRVAVIGAGVAGLACARTLLDHGVEVHLFDKGRAPGGRTSTRTAEDGATWDHGAPAFHASDPRFARCVASWHEDGVVAPWSHRTARLSRPGAPLEHLPERTLWTGTPGMSALTAHLALACPHLHLQTRVQAITGAPGAWSLQLDHAPETPPFGAVLLTIPATQAADLLRAHAPLLAFRADALASTPTFAALLAFDAPLPLTFDALELEQGPLAAAWRTSAAPRRPPGERWVLHAADAWSAEHVEAPPQERALDLLSAFQQATGLHLHPTTLTGHRWRLARPLRPSRLGALYDPDQGLGLGGDALLTPDVQGAWLSGVALAARLLASVTALPPGPVQLGLPLE